MNELEFNCHCILCDAVNDALTNKNDSKPENRLLYTTKSFIITPCIGPLSIGHILITSKKHFQNLSTMPEESIDEIKEVLDYLIHDHPKLYSNFLVAEHGAYDLEQNSGACIIHTHLHVIPVIKDVQYLFNEILEFLLKISDLKQLKDLQFPYILAGNQNSFNIYDAKNVPSQLIRRIVLSAFGEVENWNWREDLNHNYILETIKIWHEKKEYRS